MYGRIVSLMAATGAAGGSYDADAEPYIDALAALGIVNTTLNDAWDDFVLAAKAGGFWTKCPWIWPLAGGTAAAHAINAKTPGTKDITWSGSPTHNANGVTGTGSSVHGATGITPSVDMTLNSTHLAVYSRTAAASSNPDMGCIATDRLNLAVRIGSNTITEHGSNFIVSANADGQGFYVTSRRGNTDLELYKNGATMATNTGAGGGTLPNTVIGLCGSTGQGGSNRNIAFASAGAGLTDAEVAAYYTAVQAFQTALGRNV